MLITNVVARGAVCTCHDMEAYLETDHNLPYWVCAMDDIACDVIFKGDN